MKKPILVCENPYKVAKFFLDAGWSIDSQPLESCNSLVEVSLFDNHFLLGVIDEYVPPNTVPYIGLGLEFYVAIPKSEIQSVHQMHKDFLTSELQT